MSIVVWAQAAVLLVYMSYDIVWDKFCIWVELPV